MAKAKPVSGIDPRASLRDNARLIVTARSREMFGFASAIGDPTRDEELHNMRIAAKRLRYTLEMFRSLLEPNNTDLIDTIKEIQERIGAIHDADVLALTARRRLAIAAQGQAQKLVAAAGKGSEEQRVAHVRDVIEAHRDPRLGLAVLLARTQARREQNLTDLSGWWATHGGLPLQARLAGAIT